MTTDITLAQAQQALDGLGYAVTIDIDTGSIAATMTRGRHHADVKITPGHEPHTVTQSWGLTPGAPRRVHSNYEPATVQHAVDCATAVAGTITRAHEDDMVPAIIGDQLAAKYAAHAEDPVIAVAEELAEILAADEPTRCSTCADGHTYSGDCRYEVVSVAEIEVHQAPDAEPVQDGAEPDSAVTA